VAQKLAAALVNERLAACVNILPGVRSIYRWKGKVENAREALLLIKARATDYPAIEKRLRALHPYDVPEILAIEIKRGSSAYLNWLAGTG
jgi:periplasmic divalent cation tolerance protein